MSALNTGLPGRLATGAEPGRPGGGFVLPRILRRPARRLGRLGSSDYQPPRFAATIATLLLLGGAGLGGVVLGGHAEALTQSVAARTGFALEDIKITGNREISEIDIFEAVGLDGWTALVGFDVDDARARIARMPWVEDVSVRKAYPSILEVEIVERVPFAVWQQGRQLAVVDVDGAVIVPLSGRRHAALPRVVGMGAAEKAAGFLALMDKHPRLASRVSGYIRVADRRWDLRFDSGLTLRLPEADEARALAEFAALDAEYDLFSRDIAIVDLRLPDRIVVRLTEDGVAARDAALKQRRRGTERRT